MKRILLTFFIAMTFVISKASENEIIVDIIFENLSETALKSGELYIVETDERIEIKSTESFQISLPSEGKYEFSFTTKDHVAYTYYPSMITDKNNTVTILLLDKKDVILNSDVSSFPFDTNINLTDEQIEQRIANGSLNFIIHGIDSSIPNEFIAFKKKYGIGITKENCVVDPLSYKKATENNYRILVYLNKQYGKEWLQELPTKPVGIK